MSDSKKNENTGHVDFLSLAVDEQVQLIDEALSEQVYMALEMDGGGMEIMDIEGTDILIRYHGACGGCPISESGTLVFIQQTLKDKIDPRIEVKIV